MRPLIVLGACLLWLSAPLPASPQSAAIADFRIETELSEPLVVRCLSGCDWLDQAFECRRQRQRCSVVITGRVAESSQPAPDVPDRHFEGSVCLGLRTGSAEIEPANPMPSQESRQVRQGVVVLDVLPGSPAELAGFERGDVVNTFKAMALESSRQLYDAVQALAAGEPFDAMIERKGAEIQISGTLGFQTTASGCAPVEQFAGAPPAEELKAAPFKLAFALPSDGIKLRCVTGCAWGEVAMSSPSCAGFEMGRVVHQDCSVTLTIDENGMTPGAPE